MVPAQFATPEYVKLLRKDGGGLLCLAVHPKIAKRLQIPFLTDVWKSSLEKFPVFGELWPHDIPYDEKSAFSITVNHRKTFTGISDNDRSLTIRELANLGQRIIRGTYRKGDFGRSFRSPGHVVILRAADGLLHRRKGHTELSVALMEMAGLVPMAAICEMLGEDCCSLEVGEAELYAKVHNLLFIEGKEAISGYLEEQKVAIPRRKLG